ncbi:iron-sulfur cluster-binding protein NapF [Vibrio cincinnatiensis]|uniref:Ferredoxin-type protein NapF n=1 Tax=Vibrio cincinnatiensis DSM 19608 TaxID=1123491 RepID=A0A1T4S6Y6_VIBCI|nr:ferredoxin-type protein NapF [Vibrio cincinnatiensis]SKA24019.1 ferredoxin-type protein NapF [Vibrio cincinnatiensis DSM 19608]SUP06592.1 iron-sulfur cluster-binding protein NapF [Vibrio cincinnatiensis]
MIDLSKRRLFSRKSATLSTLRLPWVAKPEAFTDLCTRCGLCQKACEQKIIIHGDGGYPQIDFQQGECTFCYQCATVCPEPIFLPQSEPTWQAKVAISEHCLAKQNVECRSCGEVCESMAIQFQLQLGNVAQPILHLDDCTGCGACVSLCPTSAISVNLHP